MEAGHPGGHGGVVALLAVVGRRAKSAAVQILPQGGAEGAMDIVAWANLATQIIVQVRVCNQC